MSLNYNLERIENYEEVCFVRAPEDLPDRGVKKGERMMNPLTNVLILATVGVGLGDISEKNADEFYARLSILESLDGPFLMRSQQGARQITPQEIHMHIGLVCNVSDETRAQWLKRIRNDLDQRSGYYKRTVGWRDDG